MHQKSEENKDSGKHLDLIKNVSKYIDYFDKKVNLSSFKQIVLVVGNSRVGKSTLISFLAGDDLVVKFVDDELVIDKKDDSKAGIGHGSKSKTFYPEPLITSEAVYFDLPGFSDNRGIEKEIATAIFFKKVGDYASEVKFLVTIWW
ncbi:MAG: hypothetical protein F6K25_16555 [Okeania sp. SIO2G4]|uniref:hypothetical protein n=1 Tax=unclassified Okeania TaxID=2634635 RepID=UPI0013B72319|nr:MULTISPECIES: hypothetical protein [unclassified Okeania]NEP07594.1 hypothetical protein [Okeania sp. SIO4D6]NEP38960.1 hypothetical protein [Okeania sp. SIO2H7]NEP73660.1 hypothetical protein [Okeania sp. SIO2G5]NEP94390.1 hypothetical protein [Okeania sp. SIO2F5]NEQ92220.1 hypothetical protein [Okeania sp. SIO2G4]